jgi:hypothetical protein
LLFEVFAVNSRFLYFFDFWPLVQRFISRARYSRPRKTTN